jgi:hypothetical protein
MKKFTLILFLLLPVCYGYSQNSNTQIKFFAQPGFGYSYNADQKNNSPYFRGGQFVIYITSQISERVSVAGELNAHYEVLEDGPSTEVERLYLRYSINDNLSLRVGKTYNPLGFWNLNYNLGALLQPTISRPLILQPTHDGGFTQTRDVGVMLEGENIGASRFFFKFFVANGRGKNGGQQGASYELGKTISTNVQIGIEPSDGLKISASGIFNPLQKGSFNEFGVMLLENINYTAIAGSISFFNTERKLELIAEYYNHTNSYETLGKFTTDGAVLYLGIRTAGKVVPYFYGEYLKFTDGDSFYPTTNSHTGHSFGDVTNASLGIRYKFSPVVVFKTEAGITDEKGYGTSFGLKTQLAFSF